MLVLLSSLSSSFIAGFGQQDSCKCNQGLVSLVYHIVYISLVIFMQIKWYGAAFKSLRIRVGGSLQDQVVYKVGKHSKKCPQFKLKHEGLFGFSRGCLSMERWDRLNNLFNQTG